MKILFLAHLFPLPLDSGGKIKSYYTLKALAREHDVHVLAYVRTDQEAQLVDDLRRICHGVDVVQLSRSPLRQLSDLALSVVGGRPFIVARDYRAEMCAAFKRVVASFRPDVVHVDHLQMAQFVDGCESLRTVLDQHNVESTIVRRMAETEKAPVVRVCAGIEWPKVQRYEISACRNCDLVLTVSEEDKKTLQGFVPEKDNIECVPIGVDVSYFQPVARSGGLRNILSIGTMYWPPNVDSMLYFCREILPLVRGMVPDCSLTISGQRPVPQIRALSDEPGVTVTGYVEDVREIARECAVFVVPLRSGSGVRVKILNALAMALPVVSTSIGAEGLDVRDGQHLLIADTPESFARATARLIEDEELARRLGEEGRKLVCEKYSWEAVAERLLDVYRRRVIGNARD